MGWRGVACLQLTNVGVLVERQNHRHIHFVVTTSRFSPHVSIPGKAQPMHMERENNKQGLYYRGASMR